MCSSPVATWPVICEPWEWVNTAHSSVTPVVITLALNVCESDVPVRIGNETTALRRRTAIVRTFILLRDDRISSRRVGSQNETMFSLVASIGLMYSVV